ncbi:MAG: YdcF family protein [Proteobacteria bacterium]|nr:YdcF family protein [Pseudomonadota bacterium]
MVPPADHARIGRYMLVRTVIEPADLCFVFGSRDGVDAYVDTVATHFQAGYFPRIVIAGGDTGGDIAEADDIKARLVARGVNAAAIICERASTNTGENVAMAMPLIDREIGLENIRSLIAVGKISSSRRFLMTLKRHWPEPRRMLLPVNYFGAGADLWWEDEAFRMRVMREWNKIPSYIEKGFLAELDESDGLIA